MRTIFFALLVLIASCKTKSYDKEQSVEIITSLAEQDSVFRKLVAVTGHIVQDDIRSDSLAFLVLPVQASCPSCRKKVIKSIVKFKDNLKPNHFIVISARGGRKNINGYFKEEGEELPVIDKRLFLDTTNEASKLKLFDEKPTFYYTRNKLAYKKVSAIPATVKGDLSEFFLGYRKTE